MNITLHQLTVIHSLALRNYKNDNRCPDMDDHQFLAMCWVKAVTDILTPKQKLAFPNRRVDIPEEE